MHAPRPPQIPALLAVLEQFQVRYVLIGSAAALAYGAAVQPGDLDITPALEHENLARLAALLLAIEAAPDGQAGRWELQPDGEQRWVEQRVPPALAAARRGAWTPDPADPATLDHCFCSHYGNFDVVPELAGSYQQLIERAVQLPVLGHTVLVAHIDDLLARLTVPRRTKDAARVRQLRAIQRQRAWHGWAGSSAG